jgi:micrococcal nuclease
MLRRFLPFFLTAIVLSAQTGSLSAIAETFTATVIGVSDGDTITVLRNGQRLKVRLANIDCPEKTQGYGERAKQFTAEKSFGKKVTVNADNIDRYGRHTGEVTLPDGTSLSKSLVAEGFAWCYQKYCHDESYLVSEHDARELRIGLWSAGEQTPPWEFRKAHKAQRHNANSSKNPSH